jgi:hypothetical protein
MFSIFTIGAAAFGALMGYVFGWSSKSQTPSGGEVASLVGTLFGGSVLTTLQQFNSQYALPAYCIGVAAGYTLYIVLVQFNLTKIAESMSRGVITRNPLFPWRLERPCSVAQCPHFNMQPLGTAVTRGSCAGSCKS